MDESFLINVWHYNELHLNAGIPAVNHRSEITTRDLRALIHERWSCCRWLDTVHFSPVQVNETLVCHINQKKRQSVVADIKPGDCEAQEGTFKVSFKFFLPIVRFHMDNQLTIDWSSFLMITWVKWQRCHHNHQALAACLPWVMNHVQVRSPNDPQRDKGQKLKKLGTTSRLWQAVTSSWDRRK